MSLYVNHLPQNALLDVGGHQDLINNKGKIQIGVSIYEQEYSIKQVHLLKNGQFIYEAYKKNMNLFIVHQFVFYNKGQAQLKKFINNMIQISCQQSVLKIFILTNQKKNTKNQQIKESFLQYIRNKNQMIIQIVLNPQFKQLLSTKNITLIPILKELSQLVSSIQFLNSESKIDINESIILRNQITKKYIFYRLNNKKQSSSIQQLIKHFIVFITASSFCQVININFQSDKYFINALHSYFHKEQFDQFKQLIINIILNKQNYSLKIIRFYIQIIKEKYYNHLQTQKISCKTQTRQKQQQKQTQTELTNQTESAKQKRQQKQTKQTKRPRQTTQQNVFKQNQNCLRTIHIPQKDTSNKQYEIKQKCSNSLIQKHQPRYQLKVSNKQRKQNKNQQYRSSSSRKSSSVISMSPNRKNRKYTKVSCSILFPPKGITTSSSNLTSTFNNFRLKNSIYDQNYKKSTTSNFFKNQINNQGKQSQTCYIKENVEQTIKDYRQMMGISNKTHKHNDLNKYYKHPDTDITDDKLNKSYSSNFIKNSFNHTISSNAPNKNICDQMTQSKVYLNSQTKYQLLPASDLKVQLADKKKQKLKQSLSFFKKKVQCLGSKIVQYKGAQHNQSKIQQIHNKLIIQPSQLNFHQDKIDNRIFQQLKKNNNLTLNNIKSLNIQILPSKKSNTLAFNRKIFQINLIDKIFYQTQFNKTYDRKTLQNHFTLNNTNSCNQNKTHNSHQINTNNTNNSAQNAHMQNIYQQRQDDINHGNTKQKQNTKQHCNKSLKSLKTQKTNQQIRQQKKIQRIKQQKNIQRTKQQKQQQNKSIQQSVILSKSSLKQIFLYLNIQNKSLVDLLCSKLSYQITFFSFYLNYYFLNVQKSTPIQSINKMKTQLSQYRNKIVQSYGFNSQQKMIKQFQTPVAKILKVQLDTLLEQYWKHNNLNNRYQFLVISNTTAQILRISLAIIQNTLLIKNKHNLQQQLKAMKICTTIAKMIFCIENGLFCLSSLQMKQIWQAALDNKHQKQKKTIDKFISLHKLCQSYDSPFHQQINPRQQFKKLSQIIQFTTK